MTSEIAKPSPTPEQAHRSAVEFLNQALVVLDDLIRANPTDLEGLVRTKMILDQMGKDVKLLKEDAETKALAAMPDKKHVVDGLGLVEVTYNSKRNYDDDKVVTFLTIVAERAAQKATEHGDNVVRAVVKAVTSVLYKSAPKTTALEAYNVDPDSMSVIDWGKRSIKVSPGVMQLPSPRKTTKE